MKICNGESIDGVTKEIGFALMVCLHPPNITNDFSFFWVFEVQISPNAVGILHAKDSANDVLMHILPFR